MALEYLTATMFISLENRVSLRMINCEVYFLFLLISIICKETAETVGRSFVLVTQLTKNGKRSGLACRRDLRLAYTPGTLCHATLHWNITCLSTSLILSPCLGKRKFLTVTLAYLDFL